MRQCETFPRDRGDRNAGVGCGGCDDGRTRTDGAEVRQLFLVKP